MEPKQGKRLEPNQRWTFSQLVGLTRRHPFMISNWFLRWAFVGLVGGLFGVLYWNVLELLTHGLLKLPTWSVLVVMPLGGLIVGLVIHFLGSPGEIGVIIDNISFRSGRLDIRKSPAMILASLVGISVGGSASPEAPLVQVTGSFGTWFSDRLKLKNQDDIRTISLAGMAAGFTALFGAPLAGTMFALEILQHKYVVEYSEAIIPAVISSCTSYLVFAAIAFFGFAPTWDFPQYILRDVNDIWFAIVLGIIGVLAGWIFMWIFHACDAFWQAATRFSLFAHVPQPILRTTLTGLVLGILAYSLPLTRYFGQEQLAAIANTSFPILFLLGFALAKMAAISLTITGGWPGGFVIPLFFIGTCLGKAMALLIPGIHPYLSMICVMAAINVAVTRTPISTTLLLSQLTNFTSFTPILFSSLIGFFFAPRVNFVKSQIQSKQDNSV